MKITRRGFLKGLTALSSGAAFPKMLTAVEVKKETVTPVAEAKPGNAKAWVNFDGGSPPKIKDSFNVSGIEQIGEGEYMIQFDQDLDDIGVKKISDQIAMVDSKHLTTVSVDNDSFCVLVFG